MNRKLSSIGLLSFHHFWFEMVIQALRAGFGMTSCCILSPLFSSAWQSFLAKYGETSCYELSINTINIATQAACFKRNILSLCLEWAKQTMFGMLRDNKDNMLCHVFAEHTWCFMFHNVNGSNDPKRVGLTRMRLMSQKELRLHFGVSWFAPNLVCWELNTCCW